MAPMRREPFALAAPSASRGWGVGPAVQPRRKSQFHGEPNLLPRNLPAAAEGLSRAGARLFPTLGWRAVSLPQAPGGQVPAHRITALFGV